MDRRVQDHLGAAGAERDLLQTRDRLAHVKLRDLVRLEIIIIIIIIISLAHVELRDLVRLEEMEAGLG